MFGLKNKDIQSLRQVFAKHPNVEKVILYGSRAMGDYRYNSDIDLTIVGENLDLTEQFTIENELDDLLLPYKIDVALFHTIRNNDLIDHIQSRGHIFYDKDWQKKIVH